MGYRGMRGALLSTTVMLGLTGVALAQTVAANDDADSLQEIIVTGSRIRRPEAATAAPVTVIDQQSFLDRGYVQAGQALNQMTSNVPAMPQAKGDGTAAGGGQTFPNLLGLGAGRTLTLVDGRRFVASSTGLDSPTVDTNILPTGLIKKIEVVQGGGAAVYGSDAIAGVVNYILKDDFEGFTFDTQNGASTRGDYPQNSVRATYGHNFGNKRGNIAVDAEWSRTEPLLDKDRPSSNLAYTTASNPADTGPNDGISALRPVLDTHFWEFNNNGVIFTTPAPVSAFLLKSGGTPQQFTSGGALTAYNPGTLAGVPFASGGDGESYRNLATLYTGVERANANIIGHYDITDHLKLSGSLLFAQTTGSDPYGNSASNTVLNSPATGSGYIAFTRNNAFLTADTVAALSAASPTFRNGGPLFLSKFWDDLLPTREIKTTTDTTRVQVGLDGDFDLLDRNFYWSVSPSRGITDGRIRGWGVYTAHFNNAVNAVKNASGTIVCAINADASTANDDPGCAPLNPFGTGNVSQAAQAYVTRPSGQDILNTQDDVLATIGSDLFHAPAGAVKFNLAYEYRREKASFSPLAADQDGVLGSGVATVATSGQYHTNELSGEVLVPLLGKDFTLPLVQNLEFNGAYRLVENSAAGRENVWSAGLRWEVVSDLTLRASRSRNFRAPTLNQLFAPSSSALGPIAQDPCDADRINSGPNPAVRRANCQALFAAHPSYGPLAGFQDPAENFNTALVTTGGNADLKNEISNTTSFGFILQPHFVPGLTIIADRIQINLQNGLSAFAPQDFLATCFDTPGMPSDVCGRFSRDSTGAVTAADSTTFNAGSVRYRGETYNVDYAFDLQDVLGEGGWGALDLSVQATHTSLLETSVTGFDLTRTDGTTAQPSWVTRFDMRYVRGPLRLTYSLYYLPEEPVSRYSTIENTPYPVVGANAQHSISAQYDFGDYAVRAGIVNLTDEQPSYPTRNYGDILGRQFFVGFSAHY
ncbi:TonB-dependent receptor [Nitrospirillum viridazoti Y2]|uniref:TonB-dependent receptor-like protein n=1 Tax=Nitrospirillum amazonense TaxID=28077 RepID=A0A560HYL3_9PROT|nr:TonB-dependent receptor [Nitrospirillum amazonense]EGY01037.1 TonB-dependent receptor [Nitrospirillum amazonense Y2]TWB50659.1 TonB-dependent receptor-like protein [Nitrospirillum amazonense]